jgi:hypothetical protein
MFWNVYHKGKLIDTVCFNDDCGKDYVRESLINHDNYPSDIIIKSEGNKKKKG